LLNLHYEDHGRLELKSVREGGERRLRCSREGMSEFMINLRGDQSDDQGGYSIQRCSETWDLLYEETREHRAEEKERESMFTSGLKSKSD